MWRSGSISRVGVPGIGLGNLSVVMLCSAAEGAQALPVQRWSIQPSPNEAGATASMLLAVSCRSGEACWAVGTSYRGPQSDQVALAERRQGSAWSIEPAPTISGVHSSELDGVSCGGQRSCVAVGYTVTSRSDSVVRALAEGWNGNSWEIEANPLPGGAAVWSTLAGVSCPHPNFCVAVGGYMKNQNTEEQPLAERWNGRSWSVLAAANPQAENGSAFTSVDCVTTYDCEAVGDDDYADVAESVFAYSYNGARWVSQTQINPSGQELNSDRALSCTSGDVCTSVGIWTDDASLPLVERWDGRSWTRQSIPDPPGSVTDELNGVSCAGMACSAVGDSANNLNGNHSAAMAAEWNGTSWQIASTPGLAGASGTLAAVSCTAPTNCVAVGSSYSNTAGTTLIEDYSG
jgi:hypothetical protein